MGIGSITSAGSMSAMQMPTTGLKDQKSKNLQTEITDVQQQIQKLSSEEDLSASEKANEQKKLKREKSSLDTELKQHQEELLRSQKREEMLAELRAAQLPDKEKAAKEDSQSAETSSDTADEKTQPASEGQTPQPGTIITQNSDGTVILKEVMNAAESSGTNAENKPADEVKEAATAASEPKSEADGTDTETVTEFRPTEKEMQAMVSADASMQIAERQGTLVAKTTDGIAVLKGEIRQDAYRGTDTERKEAELKDMQKQQQQEMAFQFAMLGEAEGDMQAGPETDNAKVGAQANADKTFQVSGLSAPQQEEQAAQQGFQVAIA